MNAHMMNKLAIGLGLIGVGSLFLLDRTGLMQFDIGALLSAYWPIILIYFGLVGIIVQSRSRCWPGAYLWNFLLTGAGTILLLNNLGVTAMSFREIAHYLLPVLLIIFGISMLFRPSGRGADKESRRERREEMRRQREEWRSAHMASKAQTHTHTFHTDHKDYIHTVWNKADRRQNRSAFVGDVYLGQEYWELTSMDIAHFLGDTVIDLTTATIPMGETVLTVSAFMGDVKLYLPNDIDIEICVEASSFMGHMNILDRHEKGLMRYIRTQSNHYPEAGKKIKLIVSMFIGDVQVKRVG
jgi:lia operon protein LiaF